MRLIRLLVALLFVALGVVVGALNPQPVSLDFAFVRLPSTLGVTLLFAMLLGVLCGGLGVAASLVLPLRRQLRRERRARQTMPARTEQAQAAVVGGDA